MARVSTYLNFAGNTLEAFEFYREVFGTSFLGPVLRMGDVAGNGGVPDVADEVAGFIMHIELPILGGHVLMGTDAVESMGHHLVAGNNVEINLEPDTREEADRLYAALSEGGSNITGMSEQFWGAYWGACTDRFGTRWMVNCHSPG